MALHRSSQPPPRKGRLSGPGKSIASREPAEAYDFTLLHMLTAVDGDICARDESGFFRAQIDDEARDLFGLAEPSNWDLRQDLAVEHHGIDGRDHFRPNITRQWC